MAGVGHTNEMRDFKLENKYVLSLVQAMIGAISHNFRAVWLTLRGNTVRFEFVLEHDDPDDREEIEDIVAEFEALQETAVPIETVITVSSGPLSHPENTRFVFGRKQDVQQRTEPDCQ